MPILKVSKWRLCRISLLIKYLLHISCRIIIQTLVLRIVHQIRFRREPFNLLTLMQTQSTCLIIIVLLDGSTDQFRFQLVAAHIVALELAHLLGLLLDRQLLERVEVGLGLLDLFYGFVAVGWEEGSC